MALQDKPLVVFSLKIVTTIVVAVAVLLVSCIGGTLNRSSGGYLDLNRLILGNESYYPGVYWGRHILSKAVFALPTGILVALTGLHLRAGLVVAILTLCNLLIGWNSYANVGFEHCNFRSEEGPYDWLLGRQELHWELTQRFLREYSGMSLHGLAWTAPQGYALLQMGFGWQYSLIGCLMGLFYYLGGATARNSNIHNSSFFEHNVDFAEFYWGTFIWLVLIVSCLSQLVYRMRKWVYAKSASSVPNPHEWIQQLKYASLNRIIVRLWYEATMIILLILFACTVVFYSLIIQADIKAKGQYFFGLFIGVMALTFFMAWTWAQDYLKWQIKRTEKARQSDERQSRSPSRANDIDRVEGGLPPYSARRETDPLLPWPYSHPDKVLTDSRYSPSHYPNISRSNTPPALYGSNIQATRNNRPRLTTNTQLSSFELAIVLLWPNIEKWLWLDMFILMRHIIGFITILSMLAVFFMTMVSTVFDISSPRFNPQYIILDNSSIWPACK